VAKPFLTLNLKKAAPPVSAPKDPLSPPFLRIQKFGPIPESRRAGGKESLKVYQHVLEKRRKSSLVFSVIPKNGYGATFAVTP
jgi:hypothetical protein